MSANLPLVWANKINSPALADFIATHGPQYCMTAEEINEMRDAVNEMAVVQQSVFMGLATPTDTPTGTGARFWFTVVPGTYTNFGGVIVAANRMAIIAVSVAGAFSVSQTAFVTVKGDTGATGATGPAGPIGPTGATGATGSTKSELWNNTTGYPADTDRVWLGKIWKSNAATATTDIPGASSKWVEILTGKEDIIYELKDNGTTGTHKIGRIAEFTYALNSYNGFGLALSVVNRLSSLNYFFKSKNTTLEENPKLLRLGIKTDDRMQLLFTYKIIDTNITYSVWSVNMNNETNSIKVINKTTKGVLTENLIGVPIYTAIANYTAALTHLNGLNETIIIEDVVLSKTETDALLDLRFPPEGEESPLNNFVNSVNNLEGFEGGVVVKELFLYGSTENYENFYFKEIRRASPDWYIEISSVPNGLSADRVCAATWTVNPENTNFLTLTPRNNSGVFAKIIIDWREVANNSTKQINTKISKKSLNLKSNKLLFINDTPSLVNSAYISSSIGDDNNLGTKDSPFKTISRALSSDYNDVLLKKNDVFYEQIINTAKNISSYGEGNKPIISGLKILTLPIWVVDSPNIWKIDLSNASAYSTHNGTDYKTNNIGFIYNTETDTIYGQRFRYKNELVSNYQFWQSEKYTGLVDEDFRYLYMYSTIDPNTLSLAFATGKDGARNTGSVEGVVIECFGINGIDGISNTKFKNNKITKIGGSVLENYSNWVRLGNGIQYFVANTDLKNVEVTNNEIERCFDVALTIQGTDGIAGVENANISKNIAKNCRQGFENFLRNIDETVLDGEKKMNNVVFEDNISINQGDNGFNSSELRDGHILTNDYWKTGIKYQNNMFIGGVGFMCINKIDNKFDANILYKNKIFLKVGDYLLRNRSNYAEQLIIPANTIEQASIINSYRTLTNDFTSQIFIISPEEEEKYIALLTNKF